MRAALGDRDMTAFFDAEADLRRYLKIEAAWTRSLGEIETHPGAATIADAVETAKIDLNELAKGVEKDGLPIPALVTQLKAQTAADQHNLVHRGLTSQDVIDLSLIHI